MNAERQVEQSSDDITTNAVQTHNGTPNGTPQEESIIQRRAQDAEDATVIPPSEDTTQKLDALAKDRDALRAEVVELRRSLEQIQEKHSEETSNWQIQLEETQQGKEHAETQYKTLLGKVNTIRSQLGERLKADAV